MIQMTIEKGASVLAGALILLCLGSSVAAEQIQVTDAVRRALARSPDVRIVQEQLQGAEARRLRSVGSFLPKIDFHEQYLRTNQPVGSFGSLLNQRRFAEQDFAVERLNDPGSLDNFETRVRLYQPLFTGGKLFNHYKAAQSEEKAMQHQLCGMREQVAFRTIESYWGLSYAREQEGVAQRAVETAQESLREIELLHKEGAVVRSDLLSAMVTLAHFQDSLIKARGGVKVAERRLVLLIGDSPDGQWELMPLEPSIAEDIVALDPDKLVSTAKMKRSDYASLKARHDAAKAGVRIARAALLPAVGFEAAYAWNAPRFARDQEGSYLVGVGIEWNLFNGMQDRAYLREAQSTEATVRHELKALEDKIALEIEEAVVAVTTSRESVRATEKSVGQAEENLRIISQRYREGLATVVELEQAELALSRSRLERVRAIYDVLIAHARLKLATGEIIDMATAGASPDPPPKGLYQ